MPSYLFLRWVRVVLRRKENQAKQAKKEAEAKEKSVRRVYVVSLIPELDLTDAFSNLIRTQAASSLFLQHNTALVPPYRVLIDTNFINFSLQNKLELMSGMMDCLYAKCESRILYVMYSLLNLWPNFLYYRHPLCHGLRIG